MKRHIFKSMLALLLPFIAFGQKEKLQTKAGNAAYGTGQYDVANEAYEKAIEENPDYKEAIFNSGNALTRKSREIMEAAQAIENPEEKESMVKNAAEISKKAAAQFEKVAAVAESAEEKNKSNYNLGNARLLGGEIDPSIEAYKEALRNNPADDDARYNLAYAQWLKKQQEQQQQQNQDQQQDENQEQQEQQDQQEQEQQENQQQEQQPQPQELSKEEAEKMLDAMMNQEKDLQDELNKKRHKAQRIKIEKDW
jgi:tetratricopeptide (TPR) repeat protein